MTTTARATTTAATTRATRITTIVATTSHARTRPLAIASASFIAALATGVCGHQARAANTDSPATPDDHATLSHAGAPTLPKTPAPPSHAAGAPPPLDASSTTPDAGSPPPPPFDMRWSHVTTPSPGPAQSIGATNAGCLAGAAALPSEGPGFAVMHLARHRFFGHPALIAFIERLAADTHRRHQATIFVGDLSQPRGGPAPTGHRSHETGLDVDIAYAPPRAGKLSRAEREHAVPPAVVDLKTGALLPTWRPTTRALVLLAARDPAVDRVFVNPSIKRALCQGDATDDERAALTKVRPWWAHHDHFHVRLRCPDNAPACRPQDPLPAGDGCGATLTWWWSDDARATQTRQAKAVAAAPPTLPAACETLVPPRDAHGR